MNRQAVYTFLCGLPPVDAAWVKCRMRWRFMNIVSCYAQLLRLLFQRIIVISVDPSNNEAKMLLAEIYELQNEDRKALELVYQGQALQQLPKSFDDVIDSFAIQLLLLAKKAVLSILPRKSKIQRLQIINFRYSPKNHRRKANKKRQAPRPVEPCPERSSWSLRKARKLTQLVLIKN